MDKISTHDDAIISDMAIRFTAGIDEAGRGPIAGPVCVGMVVMRKGNEKFLKGIKDSKKLSEKKREEWFEKIKQLKKEGKLDFCYKMVSNKIIDKKGIVFSVQLGIEKNLDGVKSSTKILLDGSLKAPAKFKSQKTIIGGDNKVKVISAASVVAKVMRDKRMKLLAKKYPRYGLEKHKGYGTKEHYKKIKKFGLSRVHRKSYIKA
mgnify:FL=1|jgi:ribonuclease HII|tara:strand:- start:1399 stop:2013 length:615 start_codon:yes stop_codon:yes gene_type:complete